MNRQFSLKSVFHQFIAAFLLITTGAGALSAQTVRKTTAVNQPAKTVNPAKAGWTGVITYRKTLDETFSSDEKLLGRIDERERIKHNLTRKYSYDGRLVVNDFAGTGKATTSSRIAFRDARSQKDIQTELTNCHSWEPDRLITAESTDREITSGTGEGEAYSYSLSVYENKFHLSFTLPDFQGKHTHTTNSTYSNLCPDSTRKPAASSTDGETRIERGGASVDGEIDPKNPDVLEGSKTWFDTVGNKKSFVYTVTWKLRRKPQPLMITDVRFYEPLYPSPNDWHEIGNNDRSVDGNQVKIVATVANFGATEKTTTLNFKELKENVNLPDGAVTATIPAGGQKDVELIWDTSGYAWKQSGADVAPEANRQIEARIPDDSMEKDLTVIPKPVIVVAGLWQWPDSYRKFTDYFRAVSDKWIVSFATNDPKKVSTDNVDGLEDAIRRTQKGANAWHVDIVSYLNGGLVGRIYVNSKMPIQFDGRPTAIHLILAAVPNLGTPCAVGYMGLAFRLNTFNLDAVGELSPEAMKRFNLLVNNTNGTKFAALAGSSFPSTCQEDVPGQGIVPVASAIWRTKMNFVSKVSVSSGDFLGEVSHFRQIYKWLAVPPKGDHAPDPSTLAGNFSDENLLNPQEANFGKTRRYGAMFAVEKSADDTDPRPDFAKVVKIPAKQPTEIEIPVRNGSRFSMVLLASPDVSATLVDEKGEIIGQNLAGSPEAAEIFRTITVKKQFQAGKWKLRLESRTPGETEIAVTAFVDYTSTNFGGK